MPCTRRRKSSGFDARRQRFFKRNQVACVQIVERLIERLHAVLAGAGGNRVMNQSRPYQVDDAIANVRGGDHHFNRGDAAFSVSAAHPNAG